jgi:hypothetical protein
MAQADARNLQTRVVAGAVAGNLACPGIKKGDTIIAVQDVLAASPNLALTEFAATADDVINNTLKKAGGAGTNTTGKMLLVMWLPANPRSGPAGVNRSTGV